MTGFRAKDITRTFEHDVAAPADRIFPLLCPTREHDWVPGWTCDLIHSRSGFAELGCVFEREAPGVGRGIWVVCRYDPAALDLGFVITYPETHVERLDVSLTRLSGNQTRLNWTRTFTALNARGNEVVAEAGEAFTTRMAGLAQALERYCGSELDPGPAVEAGDHGGRYDIHLDDKFGKLKRINIKAEAAAHEPWFNQTLTTVNDSVVRLGIFKGEFHWHKHDAQDELFLVLEGVLMLDVEGHGTFTLGAHQAFTVPKGVIHRTRATERCVVLMTEAVGVVPTGD